MNDRLQREDREFGSLTEEEMELLVQRVSKRVLNNFYIEVGKTVTAKILWVIGLATVALLIYLSGSGKIKFFQ